MGYFVFQIEKLQTINNNYTQVTTLRSNHFMVKKKHFSRTAQIFKTSAEQKSMHK